MLKTICCTGDSHTWGQGASQLLESFTPAVINGDLRLAPFSPPSYVSLVRNAVNQKTNSSAKEFQAENLARQEGIAFINGCAMIEKRPLSINTPFAFLRIELRCQTAESEAEILIDGNSAARLDLKVSDDTNAFRVIPFHAGADTSHTLEIRAVSGTVLLYRIEAYCGKYAVLNCGIGSCSSKRYLSEYWERYVADCKPSVVLLEAHTINDWLSEQTPQECCAQLKEMIRRTKNLGALPILLTISPILGSQESKCTGTDYEAYVAAGKQAAADTGTFVIDANLAMREVLSQIPVPEHASYLYDDIWHVNDRGHQIYAQQIISAFEREGILKI